MIFLSFPVHPLRLERGLDRQRFYRPQQLARNSLINPWSAEGHAPGQAHHQVRFVATIDGPALRIAGIGDAQSPPTAPTRHDPGQQGFAAPAGFHAVSAAVIVERQLLLISLVFLPANVSFVMVLDHHLPGSGRLAMPVAAPRSPVNDGRPLLALSVDVNAGIKGIFENRDHIAVADRRPDEAGHATFIGRPWEVNLISCHRQQNLTSTAKVAEPGEDRPDHFLQAQIRIKPQTGFAMPDVAERYRQAQLAPARFRPRGIKHPRLKHAQLELADAALHAQEQTIVGPTGIIHAVEINNAGFDKPAQFKQMVPVAAIARQP